jgi:hypothetical protein
MTFNGSFCGELGFARGRPWPSPLLGFLNFRHELKQVLYPIEISGNSANSLAGLGKQHFGPTLKYSMEFVRE